MNDYPKEPWYVITESSPAPKIVKFCIVTMALAMMLGVCLWVGPYPFVRFPLGLASASCLLFLSYSLGVLKGASSMYAFLQERARGVASAMSAIQDALKKNESGEDREQP